MKNLKDILYNVSVNEVYGSTDVLINTINFDSRLIKLNDVFVAIIGVESDGHDYIEKAQKKGAIVIICEVLPLNRVDGLTYVVVENTKSALAHMASNYFDNPSSKLQLVGVTGTNGKTTVASLANELFTRAGYKSGLISTVKILIANKTYKSTHTTPDSLTINSYLNKMVKAKVTHCFMEVSSHGIHQKRTEGLHFKGGVFTNLSQDHLDYHHTFKEYRDVKKLF